jgi:hypothetical protein
MAMAAPAGGLEAKHYILAALTATLVAAGVVTVTSVVLSPARISFSVTEARTNNSQLATRGGGQQLLLTLAADNPSWRAAVQYQSMFVDVSNKPTTPGCSGRTGSRPTWRRPCRCGSRRAT